LGISVLRVSVEGITLAGATDLAQVAAVSGRNPLLKTAIVASDTGVKRTPGMLPCFQAG